MTFPFPMFSPITSVPLESHRYWRIYISANNGGTNTSLNEIEFYDAILGKNIATGGTPSASSSVFGYAPDAAFDGITYNGWSTTAMPVWIKYDFGSAKTIGGFGFHIGGSGGTEAPKDFELQWSDDNSTWTTYISKTNETGYTAGEFRRYYVSALPSYTGSPWGSHSYWRIFVRSANSDYAGLTEFELRPSPGGEDQASGGTASASGIYSGSFVASNAFDNNMSTFWIGSSTSYNWLQYSFASPVSVGEVLIQSRTDGNPQNTPSLWAIQFADSSSGPWTTAFNVNSGSLSYSNGESRTFADPLFLQSLGSPLARYWRIEMTATDGSTTGFAINDLELLDGTGVNIATGGTASASSTASGSAASNAFGGASWDQGSWISNTASTSWLKYDFGAGVTKKITGVVIHAPPSPANQSPKTFSVQYSNDDTTWTTLFSVADSSGWVPYESRKFFAPDYTYTGSPHAALKYWRAYCRNATDGVEVQFADIQFRASPGGADQTTNGLAFGSSQFSGSYQYAYAFDASLSTVWAASSSGVAHIGYQFITPVKVAEASFLPRSDLPGRAAQYIKVQGSNSISGPWTTIYSVQNISGWTSSVYKTYSDSAYI